MYVYVHFSRVRPLNDNEKGRSEKSCIQFPGDGAIWVRFVMSEQCLEYPQIRVSVCNYYRHELEVNVQKGIQWSIL